MHGLAFTFRQDAPIPLEVDGRCAPGELLALVGPSGSGKTTILRSIAGLYRPASGRVAINGEVWQDTASRTFVRTWQRRVGLVPQNYALFPHMTARANVAASLGDLPTSRRASRAAELLSLVNLEGLEDRRPAELSGGQQQRVAVARALARDPKVLLLDEPFSAVDKGTRSRLYQELAGIRSRLLMPIVLVTHDLDEALMLADNMCLLQRGRILQHGKPLDLLHRPATVEAARLVGQRNIFPARVVGHDAARGLTRLDWRERPLDVAHQPQWAPGTDVAWLIPSSKIVLHAPKEPPREDSDNLVAGTVASHVVLGSTTITTIAFDGRETRTLQIDVPTLAAERNRLGVGQRVSLSLLASAIHLMPAARPRSPAP